MDYLGIVAGILAGGILGAALALIGAGRGARPEPSELASRVKNLEADFERLRLDFQDTLDKVHHLYDRTRKRLDAVLPNGGPSAAEPTLTGKAAIRARLRASGVLR